METAPLTLAHTHARNAVLETRKSNPVAASEEHDLAAGEFATAAQNSSNREALRTLHLLEQHHKKLAQILRFQHENPPSAGVTTPLSTPESGRPKVSLAAPDAQQQPPKLAGNTRLPTRETSSIASNLASARGIPSQPRRASPVSPTLSSQQAGAKMTDGPARIKTSDARLRGAQPSSSRDRSYRTSTSKQPWVPPTPSPTDVTSQQFVPTDPGEASHRMNRTPDTEEPFQRFYSTFGGLISKLSAPLAFAGLPLGSDMSAQAEQSRKSTAETKLNRHHATSERINQSAEPDVSKLFSRAALQAIRDTPGGGGGGVGGVGNTAESFYVVPTTGGTISYAGILTRAEKEARRNSLEEGDEDFVDARETPSSPELRQNFVGSKGKTGRGNDKLSNLQGPKSMEELQMENQALRHLSDTLSKRLHMWEVNAQSSSMALQQSLKAIHHQNIPSPEQQPQASSTVASPIAPLSAPSTSDQDLRIKELEDLVRRSEKDLEKAGRENEKLRSVLGRYRERWEKLKEGAKTRRAEGRSSTDNTAVNTATLSSATDVRGNERRPSGETENEANLNDEPDVKADVSAT